jgi:hypothetical protein
MDNKDFKLDSIVGDGKGNIITQFRVSVTLLTELTDQDILYLHNKIMEVVGEVGSLIQTGGGRPCERCKNGTLLKCEVENCRYSHECPDCNRTK